MTWKKILGVWALLAALMIVNGAFRVMALYAWLPPRAAETTSVLLAIAIIALVTRPFLSHLAQPQSIASLARISATWLALTIAFEFSLGHWVSGISWNDLFATYAFWKGSLWPLILMTLAITPFVWAPRNAERG